MAFADKNMVSTVIRNLMTNAVKFTSDGGEIKISTEQKNGKVQVTVSDTGIGISRENKNKLFRIDTFYRTHGTDNEKGTGLGLILCQEFIEKLGGKIWVESELTKGSQFHFTLPKSK
jgi:signal transduction histidine kinase